ncbi:hypothetical protein AMATHDRAFT_11198 [Amanita thiersii Skay4041]|uniref:Uncharacterized protein n=1 Tax=Amanita thiersii Skay4041 TaxID=703135 RepID=A0A2A9N6I0_9AGAR|nr:hypothetical protein AMATHDRAFT_11198 [Amanita thiersii Skay4041]
MNPDMNWGPQSLITFLGRPCFLNMWSLNSVATPRDVIIAWVDSGNGPLKSILTVCQGSGGISFG